MIFLTICICILGYAIYLYDKGKKDKGTFIFFLFLCDGFGFFHSEWIVGMPINKYTDFALLYLGYVTVRQLYNSSRNILADFPIYKWFSFLVLYLTLEFIFTVIIGRESFGMSLAVYRRYLFFLSFILFKDMKTVQLRNVIISVSIITMIAAIVYVTQPIHQLPILDRAPLSSSLSDALLKRYRNIPELLYFILIYITARLNLSKYKSVVILLICIISLVLSQHRGVMLGYAVTVGVYLLLTRNIRKAVQYGLIGFVVFIAVGSIVLSRFENEGQASTVDDISNVVSMDYARAAANEYDTEGGTLAFRILLFVERFDYFQTRPQYMLTGVGMRHEDSPRTQKDFHFILGSTKMDEETGFWIPQQISSGDLVWFTPFVKFGLIGLGFYLYITYLMVVYLFRNRKKGTLSMVTFLFYFFLIIISLKNDMLFAPIQVSFLLMLIELLRRTRFQDTVDILKYQEFKVLGNKGV